MTFPERVSALTSFGFTERQAGFLVTVMLHAGVCVGRQYCTFARIAYGAAMHQFFQRLVARKFATARRCGHGRAWLFHVQYKPLYAAIGEADNRFRRPTPLPRAVERLMVLDAVLAPSPFAWLATERDKVQHFTRTAHVPHANLPSLIFRARGEQTVRYFPDKLPIGVGEDGRTCVLLFVAAERIPRTFRLFLERHAELLRSVPAWTIRLLVPRHLASVASTYRQAFAEHLTRPLPTNLIEEMRWLFHAYDEPGRNRDERFYRAQAAFRGPRFRALYRLWQLRGDTVLDATRSPVLAEAVERHTGVLECEMLPHPYLHLLPMVGTA